MHASQEASRRLANFTRGERAFCLTATTPLDPSRSRRSSPTSIAIQRTSAMVKRKAVVPLKATTSKCARPTPPKGEPVVLPTPSSSTLLSLPTELRTKILQYAAQDHGAGLLHRRTRGELSSRDALSRVNRQRERSTSTSSTPLHRSSKLTYSTSTSATSSPTSTSSAREKRVSCRQDRSSPTLPTRSRPLLLSLAAAS